MRLAGGGLEQGRWGWAGIYQGEKGVPGRSGVGLGGGARGMRAGSSWAGACAKGRRVPEWSGEALYLEQGERRQYRG